MKINWGAVILIALVAGIGVKAYHPKPRPVHVTAPEPTPIAKLNLALRTYAEHPTLIPLPVPTPEPNEPIALPAPRPDVPTPRHVKRPQPKPKESNARPTYRRVLKDGALGGKLECANLRPLTESERAGYENSGGRTLFVCLN